MSDSQETQTALPRRLPILLPPEDLEICTFVKLVRTLQRMERRLEQTLEPHGLSSPQFDILATLSFEEGITQQELAGRLLVTKGNICSMIDRMEHTGWVERRPDPEDRRANRMYLTVEGRARLSQAFPDQTASIARIMQALSTTELQNLYQTLDRLEERLET